MAPSRRDAFIVETERLFLQDRHGQKAYKRRLSQGWEPYTTTEVGSLLQRTSTVIVWRKPNPRYRAQ